MRPQAERLEAWGRLAADTRPGEARRDDDDVAFDRMIDTAKAILEGKMRGRVVAEVG